MNRRVASFAVIAFFTSGPYLVSGTCAADDRVREAETRIVDTLAFLASDELKGRAIGTPEIDLAAGYIAREFQTIGLRTDVFGGTPFQEFSVTGKAILRDDPGNTFSMVNAADTEGDPRTAPVVQEDFQPLAIGGSGIFDAPAVFVGYGIVYPEAGYDEYEEVDVKSKVVVILRKEPQQFDKNSVFNGTSPSNHAFFATKVQQAVKRGAAAVVFVNDQHEVRREKQRMENRWTAQLRKLKKEIEAEHNSPEEHRSAIVRHADQLLQYDKAVRNADQIMKIDGAGSSSIAKFPVLFCKRELLRAAIEKRIGMTLEEMEDKIDKTLQPVSCDLEGWRIKGQTSLTHEKRTAKNVVGVLDGTGPGVDKTIVIGAHYDHVGMGGAGSLAPWTHEVHNGADDNASGVAALLEVARQLASQRQTLKCRVVFIAFSGEESGLLGSAHYADHPRYPLNKTVAMLNLDMVGRLGKNRLEIHGTKTAEEWEPVLDELANKHEFTLKKRPEGNGPSDHATFNAKRIPALHFFTGLHADYHRPGDDVEKIDVVGIRRIADLLADTALAVCEIDQGLKFAGARQRKTSRGAYLGVIADFSNNQCRIDRLVDGPAKTAGIRIGDILVSMNGENVDSRRSLMRELAKRQADDEVEIVVEREKAQQSFNVKLAKPR